jgi:predicted ester cyclase
MKHTILKPVIVAIAVLSSCSHPENDKNSIENVMPVISAAIRNEQTAMLSIQAFNSHNVNEILKNWDSSAIEYGDGTGRSITGIDSIRYLYSMSLRAVPNLRVDSLKTLTDDGEHVIVTGQWSGTVKNDSLGIKEKKINFWNGDFFTFNESGKIIQHKSIQSHLTILAQLGLLNKRKKQ